MWLECRGAFEQDRTWQKAKTLAMGSLVGLGRRTVTGLLYSSAQQFQDWSAYYRLFSQHRFDEEAIFSVVRRGILEELPKERPLIVSMDDTLLRKKGTRIPGVGWRRDPLGPPFQTNFVRAQRALQLSAALPQGDGTRWARMIPIDFSHAPSARKPRKSAPEHEWREYWAAKKELNLSCQGVNRLQKLRARLDADEPGHERHLWTVVDGSFTNGNVLKRLPARTTLIGRIRSDAKLHRTFRTSRVGFPRIRARSPSTGLGKEQFGDAS